MPVSPECGLEYFPNIDSHEESFKLVLSVWISKISHLKRTAPWRPVTQAIFTKFYFLQDNQDINVDFTIYVLFVSGRFYLATYAGRFRSKKP